MSDRPKNVLAHDRAERARALGKALRALYDGTLAAHRRKSSEVSGEYLDALQHQIDSKLGEGRTFKTVKRASW
jgi:hypothetical protein